VAWLHIALISLFARVRGTAAADLPEHEREVLFAEVVRRSEDNLTYCWDSAPVVSWMLNAGVRRDLGFGETMDVGPGSRPAQPHAWRAGYPLVRGTGRGDHYEGMTLSLHSSCSSHRMPGGIGRCGPRPVLSIVHKRRELMGTFAVSSIGHRTVSGFHAHGGTAIAVNLRQARPTPIVRDGVVDIDPVVRLNLCFSHRILDGASSRSACGSGGRTGGGSVTREISTDVCVVPDQLRERRISHAAATEPLIRVNFAGWELGRPSNDVPPPILLRTLTDAAAVHPHFMLVRSAGATDLLRSGGKVTGVSARTPDGDIRAGVAGRSGDVLGRPGLADRKLPISRDVSAPPRRTCHCEVHLGAKCARSPAPPGRGRCR
jgi:hypothetical protein